jgi:hypothetical protein
LPKFIFIGSLITSGSITNIINILRIIGGVSGIGSPISLNSNLINFGINYIMKYRENPLQIASNSYASAVASSLEKATINKILPDGSIEQIPATIIKDLFNKVYAIFIGTSAERSPLKALPINVSPTDGSFILPDTIGGEYNLIPPQDLNIEGTPGYYGILLLVLSVFAYSLSSHYSISNTPNPTPEVQGHKRAIRTLDLTISIAFLLIILYYFGKDLLLTNGIGPFFNSILLIASSIYPIIGNMTNIFS